MAMVFQGFNLYQTSPIGSDSTGGYGIYFKGDNPTVGEFIEHLFRTRNSEWGFIIVRDYARMTEIYKKVGFQYGHLIDDLPDAIGSMTVKLANASGGWSRMEYILSV